MLTKQWNLTTKVLNVGRRYRDDITKYFFFAFRDESGINIRILILIADS